MKILCPSCKAAIPAANVNLGSGWSKCEACHELFRFAAASSEPAPGAVAAEQPTERPFNARAVVERSRDKLSVRVPAEGMRAASWAKLGFGLFGLAFAALWTAGALGVLTGQWPPDKDRIMFAAFSIPMWLGDFAWIASVVWRARSTRTACLDAVSNELTIETRCLSWSRTKRLDLTALRQARPYKQTVSSDGGNTTVSSGVELVFDRGSFVLPTDSDDEQKWLELEINDFVTTLAQPRLH